MKEAKSRLNLGNWAYVETAIKKVVQKSIAIDKYIRTCLISKFNFIIPLSRVLVIEL